MAAVQERGKKSRRRTSTGRKGTPASRATWTPPRSEGRSDNTHRHEAAAILSFLGQKSHQSLAVPLDLQLLLQSRYLEVSVNEDFEFTSWQVWGLTRSMFRVAIKAQERLFLLIYLPPLLCFRCHLWTKLFPPVPVPKSNANDFLVTINNEVILKVL